LAIYTCYDMIADCRANKREGWIYFVKQYLPVCKQLLQRYHSNRSADKDLINRVIVALSKPDSPLFQSRGMTPEREFVAELRQYVLAAVEEDRPSAPPEIPLDLDTLTRAVEGFSAIECQVVWLTTMGYSPEEISTVLRMDAGTARKIIDRCLENLRHQMDQWSQDLLQTNGAALAAQALSQKSDSCAALRDFQDLLDGKMTWNRRQNLELHLVKCWYCVDRAARFREVDELLSHNRPLTSEEAEPYLKLLGIESKKPSIWKRMLGATALALILIPAAYPQTTEQPVRAVTDPGVVTTRQAITPAGIPAVFQGRVYDVVFGSSTSEVWVLNAGQVIRFDYRANKVLQRVPFSGNAGLQGLVFDPVKNRPLVSSTDKARKARLATINANGWQELAADFGRNITGAPAVATKPQPGGKRVAVVPLIFDNKLAIIDADDGTFLQSVNTGIAPFGAAINANGTVAYVTNWGGRLPQPQDLTAPTGFNPEADRVVVDKRGIASTGTVTRIDLVAMNATHTIPVELHPMAIVWDEERGRVYVANGNKDSVSVIDVKQNRVVQTFPVQPFTQHAPGIAPTALALSPDGSRLFVACGGINAIAVMDATNGRIEGLIPTAWYPNAITVSPDGKKLAVSSLLGAGSGWRDEPRKRFVHSYRGSISVIDMPDRAQLASYTTAVAENNHLAVGPMRPAPPISTNAKPVAIPARAGEPSLIEHVVYIIKENRTYDQVFGDLQKGNGDPSLVMFGADVTPNHRRLAEQFVLLDNFYATGGNSADGHQWVTQANETAYCLWPGYTGRSYPFDGSDPIAYSHGGFIWDAALNRGKTVRIYGEYAGRMLNTKPEQRIRYLERWTRGEDFTKEFYITAPIEPLNKILARQYPSYSNDIPDVVRASIFLADLKEWVKTGKMPNLVIIQLPNDHTLGTLPGVSTPKAMVADNDYALGQIVEALSKSPFWKKMAIFVVEDDAQNGVDHVDGHRTVALAISPYSRRGHVDSTFYSHQSMLKTIELILGLPSLSLFDLIATDMRASFQNEPDFTPYEAVKPQQSLTELNPPLQALSGPARRAALDSMKMRWDVPDAVPSDRLNRILWGVTRGWNTKYPGTRQAVFAPLSLDLDDDERETR